jgi:hypothetical protein
LSRDSYRNHRTWVVWTAAMEFSLAIRAMNMIMLAGTMEPINST